MSARRRFLLCVSFLALALPLASGSARAQFSRPAPQPPGQHEPITGPLSPEQVKQALERLLKADGFPPEMLDALKKQMKAEGKEIGENQLKAMLEMLERNPALRKQLEQWGQSHRAKGGKQLPPEELNKLRDLLSRQPPMAPGKGITQPPFPPPGGPAPPAPPLPGKEDLKNTNPGGGEPVRPPTPPAPAGPNPEIPALPNPMLGGAGEVPIPKIDPNPGAGPFDPNETPKERAMRTAASLWERNVGPLKETPAVEKMLYDLVDGTEGLKDAEGNSIWDTLSKETGDATSFSDFLKDAALGDSWTMPKFDMPSFNWGRSDWDFGRDRGRSSSGEGWRLGRGSSPSGSRGGWSGPGVPSVNLPGIGAVGWPALVFVLILVVLFGCILIWRMWDWKKTVPDDGLGLSDLSKWPIDPRRIATREHVVIAFEYLSVLICGPTAKTWTHNTIAQALADLAVSHAETAAMLARLYELARYAPLDEPLTTAEVAEARRLVCRLAGLEYE